MEQEEINMHLAAGKFFGKFSACGKKVTYPEESDAVKSAISLNKSDNRRHEVEAYPCYWCSEDTFMWHIGRIMTNEERKVFSALAELYPDIR